MILWNLPPWNLQHGFCAGMDVWDNPKSFWINYDLCDPRKGQKRGLQKPLIDWLIYWLIDSLTLRFLQTLLLMFLFPLVACLVRRSKNPNKLPSWRPTVYLLYFCLTNYFCCVNIVARYFLRILTEFYYMATIVRPLWLAAEWALFSCNDRALWNFSRLFWVVSKSNERVGENNEKDGQKVVQLYFQ